MSGLLSIVVTIIIVGVVFYLIYWLLGEAGLPDPFNKVARVLIGLVAVIYLIGILTGQAPMIKLPS